MVGSREQEQPAFGPRLDRCPLEFVREWPLVWIGYDGYGFSNWEMFGQFASEHRVAKKEMEKNLEQEKWTLRDL
jgi:hypothetical protein